MIPPRFVPPGVLQLFEVDSDGSKKLLHELPSSSRNRIRLQNMRNDLLMVDPTKNLQLSENNAFK